MAQGVLLEADGIPAEHSERGGAEAGSRSRPCCPSRSGYRVRGRRRRENLARTGRVGPRGESRTIPRTTNRSWSELSRGYWHPLTGIGTISDVQRNTCSRYHGLDLTNPLPPFSSC